MRKLFAVVLALCLAICGASAALATEATGATEPTNVPREPGYCGENITWSLSDGVLTITGQGEMDDFPQGAPWSGEKDAVKKIILSEGITYVGGYAFPNFDKLETVEFGSSVYEIGPGAFYSCDALTELHLPASFKVFGEESFRACANLKAIHCRGRFPSFRLNCLWDTYATIYFPAERPWSVEYIQQLEDAFHGRIEFLASDGSDPYEPTEATEPAQTAPPETTTPPTTVPPTTVPTEPTEAVTEPAQTTAPATTAPGQTVTETPVQTVPATEPQDEEQDGGSWAPFLLIGGAGGFLILGALIFRFTQRRGRYSKKRRRR